MSAPDNRDDGPPFAPAEALDALVEGMGQQSGNAPTYPHPLILAHPGLKVMWARTRDERWVVVDERTLKDELRHQWPSVPMKRLDASGKVIDCSSAFLVGAHSRRVDTLIYDLTVDRSAYIPNPDDRGGELILQCATLDPAATPHYDPEVASWLDRFGGNARAKLLDWLATAHELKHITAAAYLYGPRNAGKGLLASGVARLWGREVTAYEHVVAGRFSGGLIRCPVILLDEGAPADKDASSKFRNIVGMRTHSIEEKHRPTWTLRGAVRVIIAANNLDALRLREDLTLEDEAAIGQRIFMVRIPAEDDPEGPVAFLRSHPHHDWIEDAKGKPGRLVRHIAWLQANRQVKRGSRFLVEGDGEAWIRGAARRGGLQSEVLIAIARFAIKPGTVAAENTPIFFKDNFALVSADRLQTCWQLIMPGSKVPSVTAIGRALSVFCDDTIDDRWELPSGKRLRVRAIPGSLILEAAAAAGVGDEDELAAVLK